MTQGRGRRGNACIAPPDLSSSPNLSTGKEKRAAFAEPALLWYTFGRDIPWGTWGTTPPPGGRTAGVLAMAQTQPKAEEQRGPRTWWRRLGLPVRVGLGAALTACVLALVGLARGFAPLTPSTVLLALLISGGSWGLVAWAVTTAALESEEVEPEEGGEEGA